HVRGPGVEAIERSELLRLHLGTGHEADRVDGRPCTLSLLADLLALARGQLGQERVEARVVTVVPVKLVAGPRRETSSDQALALVGGREQPVDRVTPTLVGELAHGRDQARGHGVTAGSVEPRM